MEVTAPEGPAKGWTWAAPMAASPTVDAATQKEIDLGLRLSPDAVQAAHAPLAHPTGLEPIDDLTSPANLILAATAGLGLGRAIAQGGAGAMAKFTAGAAEAVAQASPILKYEATKTLLQAAGVPPGLASVGAMMVSGYQGKGKVAAVEPVPTGAHLDRSVPVQAGRLTPQQLQERVLAGTGVAPQTRNLPKPAAGGTPPATPETPTPASAPTADTLRAESRARFDAAQPATPTNSLPDQKALNEEALARARAAFAAKKAAAAAPVEPAAAAPAPMKALSVDEVKLGEALVKQGLSPPDAYQRILALRAQFAQSALGQLPSATEARAAIAAKKYKS